MGEAAVSRKSCLGWALCWGCPRAQSRAAHTSGVPSAACRVSTLSQISCTASWGEEGLGWAHRAGRTMCVHAQFLSRFRLFASPMDYSPPGSSVHGISQARILEWVAISSSRGSFQPRDPARVPCISCIRRWFLDHCATWEAPEMSLLTPKSLGHTHITARPALWEEGLH